MYYQLKIAQVFIISIIIVVNIQLSGASKKFSNPFTRQMNRMASSISISAFAVHPNSSSRSHCGSKPKTVHSRFEPQKRERRIRNVSMFSSTTNSRDMQFPSRGEMKPIKEIKQSSLERKLNIQDLAIYLTYILSMIAYSKSINSSACICICSTTLIDISLKSPKSFTCHSNPDDCSRPDIEYQ